jgi:hypothetical protein
MLHRKGAHAIPGEGPSENLKAAFHVRSGSSQKNVLKHVPSNYGETYESDGSASLSGDEGENVRMGSSKNMLSLGKRMSGLKIRSSEPDNYAEQAMKNLFGEPDVDDDEEYECPCCTKMKEEVDPKLVALLQTFGKPGTSEANW